MKTPPERLAAIAFFGALCLFFATLENLIPKLPFFRLGLANLPILLALPLFRGRELALLVALKVVGQALVNGTLASYVFLFSLSSSLSSAVVMYAAWRWGGSRISTVGVSLLGALASNAVQIALSVAFVFGAGAWVIAPLLMGLGVATGLFVGVAAGQIERRSRWYAGLAAGRGNLPPPEPAAGGGPPPAKRRRRAWRAPPSWDFLGRAASPALLFWAGIALLPALFFQPRLELRCLQAALFACLAVTAGKRVSWGYFGGLAAMIVAFNLLVPAGRVLLTVGGFALTEGALLDGCAKAAGIVGLVMLSLATVRPRLRLPGSLGGLVGRTFQHYEELLSWRGGFDPRRPIASVDRILFGLGRGAPDAPAAAAAPRSSALGAALVAALLAANWGLLAVGFAWRPTP